MFAAINPEWLFTAIIAFWGVGIGAIIALLYGLFNFKTNKGQGCIAISCVILMIYFIVITK